MTGWADRFRAGPVAPRPRRPGGSSPHVPRERARIVRGALLVALALMVGVGGDVLPARGQGEAPDRDSLLITPTTQGTVALPHTAITLDIAYATVNEPAHLTIQRDGERITVAATGSTGSALARLEMPLIVSFPTDGETVTRLVGWPETFDSARRGRWLVVFDAHGLYALPADGPAPESVLYLGPLEHYTPGLLEHDLDWGSARFEAGPPLERAILRTMDDSGEPVSTALPTAARADRYHDRFLPEDLSNPGGWQLLGWTDADRLPAIARALRATLPADPDLPAPGVLQAPLKLILPFDCTHDWIISWGYHHSTPQNRFAVDFAALAPTGTQDQPVYAAHAGTVSLKRYGSPDHLIDVGLSARVLAADGITSTVYGHLDPSGTFALWDLDPAALPDFEWVEVGAAAPAQVIGVAGGTGYATGPHLHFALWSWDQSLYQPVPLGPLGEFPRGLQIPAALRANCPDYRTAH